jgi:hypothetical protein
MSDLMNNVIIEKINMLEKRLIYHAYEIEIEAAFSCDSLIKTLEDTLKYKQHEILIIPDVTLPFRDVIETLHQINKLVLCEDKDEIDRDFFGTGVHLSISYDISVISKSLLDCHHRFKIHGIASDILALYTWLLNEVWYNILCQDALDVWNIVTDLIYKKIQYSDEKYYLPLVKCIPLEKKEG